MSDNLKATVLRDFSYTRRPGEEELAIKRFLQAAPEHVAIHIQPPEVIQTKEAIESADVLITFGLKRYPDNMLDLVLEHPRHVHVAQDWWEDTQPQAAYRNRIVERAALVVFSSLLHQDRYEHLYHVKPEVAWTIPFPMLKSDYAFFDPAAEKEDAVLWCAAWHPDYGSDLMLAWAAREEQQVDAFGLEVPVEQIVPLVKGCGPIALDAAALVFASYSRFAYFPRKPIPFGFAFLLAWKLGLELTYSGEIGCLSEGNDLERLSRVCTDAPRLFWDAVEEVAA